MVSASSHSGSVTAGLFSLRDATDIHCEAPSLEFLRLARSASLRNVVIKWPGGADSAPVAEIANAKGEGATVFWGGVVLDRAAGAMSCAAVEASAARRGRFVWMPTVDALHHRRINGQSERGAVHLLDERGRLLPDVHKVLESAGMCGLVVGTGHISPEEAELVVDCAHQHGVRKIVVNHPLLLGFSLDDVKRIVRYPGVFIEHCYVPDHPKPFDVGRIINAIDVVGPRQSLIADFGAFGEQANIADALIGRGIASEVVHRLAVENPAQVLS